MDKKQVIIVSLLIIAVVLSTAAVVMNSAVFNNLQISIKDNGIGIPEADKEKLFSKFYRAENAVRLQTEGSGLGLFITRNIVKKHGGDINFESEEGVGTKFIITLPIDYELSEDEKGGI